MIHSLVILIEVLFLDIISTGWFAVSLIFPHRLRPWPLFRVALLAILAGFMAPGPGFAQENSPEQATEQAFGQAVGRVTGYAIPRFVSLKSGQVNMRHGPGESYAIDWIFQRRGMPVEVIAEHDNWRKIRDHDGAEGWIHFQLLDGRRMGLVKGGPVSLYRRQDTATSGVAAIADPGVILRLHSCGAKWCRAEVSGYKGWVTRDNLFGVYAGEEFD